jgi:hypothetical protein
LSLLDVRAESGAYKLQLNVHQFYLQGLAKNKWS